LIKNLLNLPDVVAQHVVRQSHKEERLLV
jgi:hypothetical protein